MKITRRCYKNVQQKLALLLCLLLVFTLLPIGTVRADTAAAGVICVTENGGEIHLATGGVMQLQVPSVVQYDGSSYTVSRKAYSSYDDSVALVDAEGKVTAVHTGNTQIMVEVYTMQTISDGWDNEYDDYNYNQGSYSTYEQLLYQAYYDVTVSPDLSQVKIDKTSQTSYTSDMWAMPTYTFHLTSEEPLTENWNTVVLSCTSSNSNISVYASLENNVLTLAPSTAGKTTVTVSINDQKLFQLKINTIYVNLTANSALMIPGQTKQLHVKGGKNLPVKWSSSNKSVVTVSSDGKLTARKNGNAVIKAKVGDCAFGCAVSVVSAGRKQVINQAIRIAQTCTYSQPYRMEAKYYDCSSLVWKAYAKSGINFGGSYYAPVAADIAKWCVTNNKIVKGGVSRANVNQMKLNAGDLMFETGADNGRYRGIYHVEMITGYSCEGFDSKGRPYLQIKWASKPDGYYGSARQLVGRP